MGTKQGILQPVGGVSREIGFYLAGLEASRAQTISIIKDLTPGELAQRFTPAFHQIGGLALHLGECEYWWIQAGLAGRKLTDDDIKFAHIYDTTETDFALKGYTADDCIDFLARIHQCSIDTLARFTDEDVDKVVRFEQHPEQLEGTLRWVLHRMTDHEANHRGQMAMIKRLIRETPVKLSVDSRK